MNKIITLAALAATLALAGCGVNPNQATATLEAMGMTNVQIGGYSPWGCGENDTFASHFSATGVNGKPISGVVCSGTFKGMTVRFD